MLRFKRTEEFAKWLRKLKDRRAKARIQLFLDQCEANNRMLGIAKPLEGSLYEIKFDYGPGYRIYYSRMGSEIHLLLIGGDKSSQQRDIEAARRLLDEYTN